GLGPHLAGPGRRGSRRRRTGPVGGGALAPGDPGGRVDRAGPGAGGGQPSSVVRQRAGDAAATTAAADTDDADPGLRRGRDRPGGADRAAGGGVNARVHDVGLQAERTRLAWARTALALAVIGALELRIGDQAATLVHRLPGLGTLLLAVACWLH